LMPLFYDRIVIVLWWEECRANSPRDSTVLRGAYLKP